MLFAFSSVNFMYWCLCLAKQSHCIASLRHLHVQIKSWNWLRSSKRCRKTIRVNNVVTYIIGLLRKEVSLYLLDKRGRSIMSCRKRTYYSSHAKWHHRFHYMVNSINASIYKSFNFISNLPLQTIFHVDVNLIFWYLYYWYYALVLRAPYGLRALSNSWMKPPL